MTMLRATAFATALLGSGAALAAGDGTAIAGGGLGTAELVGATLRMAGGLVVVLGLLALAAWASRRFRITGRLRSGLIEVVSGISLGTREKVVLLRVGREQVLVGVSPAGMRTLHVIRNPDAQGFDTVLATQTGETRP
jgi:flagellar biosynthetic protein FliO